MKCLSIHPYWVSKMLLGKKTIEVRTWNTSYRGDILICTTKRRGDNACVQGNGVLIASLSDVTPFLKAHLKESCLPAMPKKNAFAWHLTNFRFISPIQIKGSLSLYERDVQPKIIPRESALLNLSSIYQLET